LKKEKQISKAAAA